MKKSNIKVASFALLVLLMATACTPPVEPTKGVSPQPPAVAPAKGSWQGEWDQVLADARKEGKVVWSTDYAPDVRIALSKAFSARYGVELELVTYGRSAELQAKMLAERRAGLHTADIYTGGLPSPYLVLVPQGALDPLDKMLILPEVTDPKAWWGGQLRWIDPDHYMLGMLAYGLVQLHVNSKLVNPQEIKSYRDLLNPKWKGKILMVDPTTFGGGNSWFTSVAFGIMDVEYLRELVKQQPVIIRDIRLVAEWLAKEKYPIAVGLQTDVIQEFMTAGAPIAPIVPVEGVQLSAANGNIAVWNRAPHPAATRLFVNWLLTREGQTVFSRAFGAQSARVDVPTDSLDPTTIRRQDVKYFDAIALPYHMKKSEAMELAKDMYKDLLK